jgi:hypothetical protein
MDFITLKIHRPRPGLNPRTLGLVASTLTTTPPRATPRCNMRPGYKADTSYLSSPRCNMRPGYKADTSYLSSPRCNMRPGYKADTSYLSSPRCNMKPGYEADTVVCPHRGLVWASSVCRWQCLRLHRCFVTIHDNFSHFNGRYLNSAVETTSLNWPIISHAWVI